MKKHIRALSTTVNNNIQASAHAIAEVGHEAVTRSTNAVQHILLYHQLPHWMKVDPYIKRGYRRELNSFTDCFWSLFYPHNELVNTWSHLLPAMCYLPLLLGIDFCKYAFQNSPHPSLILLFSPKTCLGSKWSYNSHSLFCKLSLPHPRGTTDSEMCRGTPQRH